MGAACRAVRGRPAHFLARWAAAIGALFADPGFQVSRDGFEQFLTLQRWLAAIFGATPFGHADHVIAALAGAMPGQGGALALSGRLAQVLRVVRAGFRTGRAAGRALGA